ATLVALADQSSSRHHLVPRVDRGNAMLRRKRSNLVTARGEECACGYAERACCIGCYFCEGSLKIGIAADRVYTTRRNRNAFAARFKSLNCSSAIALPACASTATTSARAQGRAAVLAALPRDRRCRRSCR